MAPQRSTPSLIPLTQEARVAAGAEHISLPYFPFRVGRESRYGIIEGKVVSMERRNSDAKPNNDLYLRDNEEFLNVSREHFQIERKADGTYELHDRGSTCGTIVDDQVAGGPSNVSHLALRDGCVIRVGTAASPFAYRFAINSHHPAA